jgi:phytanoyl-CoA hydroxylase
MTPQLIEFTESQIEQFREQGFLVMPRSLRIEGVERVDARLDPLFDTQFETGVYPDEWHGRPGLSQPNATRQMANLWRCDRAVASLSFSADIARLGATLAGWSGTRFAMDSCWIKPSDAPEVAFHRNNTTVSCINPASMITCWIAFNDITLDMAPLRVVPGSHQWQCSDQFRFVHAPDYDYRKPVWDAAVEAGVQSFTIVPLALAAGDCVFLHGALWHGSGRNESARTRRSFAISMLPVNAQFQPLGAGVGYIFSRYRRLDNNTLDESFFPILWTQEGYRSAMVDEYCQEHSPEGEGRGQKAKVSD